MTNANNFCWCLGHVISIILKVYFYHYLNRSIYKEKKYTGSRYLIVRTSILYFVFDGLIFDIKTFFSIHHQNIKNLYEKRKWHDVDIWWFVFWRCTLYYLSTFVCDHNIIISFVWMNILHIYQKRHFSMLSLSS